MLYGPSCKHDRSDVNESCTIVIVCLQSLCYTAHCKAWRLVQELETKHLDLIDYGNVIHRAIGDASDKIVRIAREKVDCLPTIKTAAFVILGDGVELTREDLIMSRTRYYKTQAGLLKMEVELVPKTEAENVSRQIDEAYQNATDESNPSC